MTETEPGEVTKALRTYRQTGSSDSFTVLYERVSEFVKTIARRKLGKMAKLMDVDDVVQSVMLRFIKGMGGKKTWFVQKAQGEESLGQCYVI